jgi:hypothetical protein
MKRQTPPTKTKRRIRQQRKNDGRVSVSVFAKMVRDAQSVNRTN